MVNWEAVEAQRRRRHWTRYSGWALAFVFAFTKWEEKWKLARVIGYALT